MQREQGGAQEAQLHGAGRADCVALADSQHHQKTDDTGDVEDVLEGPEADVSGRQSLGVLPEDREQQHRCPKGGYRRDQEEHRRQRDAAAVRAKSGEVVWFVDSGPERDCSKDGCHGRQDEQHANDNRRPSIRVHDVHLTFIVSKAARNSPHHHEHGGHAGVDKCRESPTWPLNGL